MIGFLKFGKNEEFLSKENIDKENLSLNKMNSLF